MEIELPEPDGFLEHGLIGTFLSYTPTASNPQEALYTEAKVRQAIAAAVAAEREACANFLQELEAMLEAVGAGGVSAQRITQAAQAPATAIQERDKFEQLMAASYPNLSFERHSYQYDHNRFKQYKVQWLWEGWQARAALDASDHIEQPLEMVAAPVVLPEPVAVQIRHIKEERWRTIALVLYDLFAGDEYERRYIYTEQQVRDLLAEAACTKSQTTAQEPFGYFKAEPFGWRDCAETDEGAIALYEAPQPQADGRDAQRYRWLIDYFISDRVDLDDAIVAAKTSEDIAKIIDAAIAAAKEKAK